MSKKKEDPVILWTPKKLKELKKAIRACDSAEDIFIFEGHEILCSYAHYLAEYLEQIFSEGPAN